MPQTNGFFQNYKNLQGDEICFAVILDNIGKIGATYQQIDEISTITGLGKENFTTSLGFLLNDKYFYMPLNSKTFNDDYFQKYVYENIRNGRATKVVIKLKLYRKDGKIILVLVEDVVCVLSN